MLNCMTPCCPRWQRNVHKQGHKEDDTMHGLLIGPSAALEGVAKLQALGQTGAGNKPWWQQPQQLQPELTGRGSSYCSQLLCATSSASASTSTPSTAGLPNSAAPIASMPCKQEVTTQHSTSCHIVSHHAMRDTTNSFHHYMMATLCAKRLQYEQGCLSHRVCSAHCLLQLLHLR
jgi:hypothetical protein